jgi:hypothetical protein
VAVDLALGERLAAQVLPDQVEVLQPESDEVPPVDPVVAAQAVRVVVARAARVDAVQVNVGRHERNRVLVVVKILMRCCHRH